MAVLQHNVTMLWSCVKSMWKKCIN